MHASLDKTYFGSLKRTESGKDKDTHTYQQEIRSMMYACGDVRVPDRRSSIYLEQVVYVQMKSILERAANLSRLRGSKNIHIEDVVFVLRKNPCRLKKLSNYLFFKDIRSRVKREVAHIPLTKPCLKYDWLPSSANDGDSTELRERLAVIDRMTASMSADEYLDFTECRKASFTFRKVKKFREFLCPEQKIKDDVVDVLGFVACELVFDIVSLASEMSRARSQRATPCDDLGGIFRTAPRKVPVTISDIDEACRRLKACNLT